MSHADHEDMSEDEDAVIVALHNGSEPSGHDPVCKALEARGLARSAKSSWELTPAGVDYLAQLGERTARPPDS
jgi:hypothetical protein